MIYINDLTEGLTTNEKLFADDTSSFSIAHDIQTSANDLNKDLGFTTYCKLLVNILVQYAGKSSERTQSSVVDVRSGFTRSVPISQVD